MFLKFGSVMWESLVYRFLKQLIKVGSVTVIYGEKQCSFGDPKSVYKGTLIVKNPNFFSRVVKEGEIGFGESYVAKEWESPSIEELLVVFALNYKNFSNSKLIRITNAFKSIKEFIKNKYHTFTKESSIKGVGQAYNVGNDFFRHMLGETMLYTCAFFRKNEDSLEEAQNHKLDVIIQKLGLSRDHKVLDIGCGWGTLLREIYQRYGCDVRGIALADEQIKFCKNAHSFGQFDYLDYRDLEEQEQYDRVVSVGMLEHVGKEYWQTYADKVAQVLKSNGRALLHTMMKSPILNEGLVPDGKQWLFIDKWVLQCWQFPHDHDLLSALHATGKLRVIHQEKWGVHYGETLRRWIQNIRKNTNEILKTHSEEIIRAFEYSWACGAACFSTGVFDLWQIVVEKSPCTLNASVFDPRAEADHQTRNSSSRSEVSQRN